MTDGTVTVRGCAGPGAGQADGLAAGDRRAARRVPRARGGDAHPRPGRRAADRRRGVRARRRRRAGSAVRRAAGPGQNLVERALPACDRRAAVHLTQATRWAAGWAAGRRTLRPCCAGPGVPTRRGGPARCRRAVLPGGRAGPGRGCRGEGLAARVRGPGLPAAPAALRRGHGPGLPGLGRGSTVGGAERPHRRGAGRRASSGALA